MASAAERALPEPPARRIVEVKEALAGGRRRFDLECWLHTPAVVVGRWRATAGNDYGVPAGTTSWGVWWRTRPYGVYRFHDSGGALRGYRVDALERVRITAAEVCYRDLLLDGRISPEGEVRIEDEEEVAAAVAAGLMTRGQERRARCVGALLLQRGSRIVARVDAAVAAAVAAVTAAAVRAAGESR